MNKIIKTNVAEEREYQRLKSVFPVEFSIDAEEQNDIRWYQGYTCDISAGGLCLETSFMDEAMAQYIQQKEAVLNICIRIPLGQPEVVAKVKVAWVRQKAKIHHIGLRFFHIEKAAIDKMMRQIWWMRFSTYIVLTVTLLFLLGFVSTGIYSHYLRQTNASLVEQLVNAQLETVEVKMSLYQIENQKGKVSELLNKPLQSKERQELVAQYHALERQTIQANEQFASMRHAKSELQQSVLETMDVWLKNHQSPSTGLVLSFEGNVGVVKHWAFIYDQALAACVFMKNGEIESAKKIFNFFNRHLVEPFEGFNNGYYFDSGEVSEWTVHCGPNIWMGIALMQYQQMTGDDAYLPLTKKIADWLISVQDKDPAGGLKGGPKFTWFATEHNLDAYAFFGMVYATTKDEKYNMAQNKILFWLQEYAMIPHAKDYQTPPVNRGRGDSTVATDTFAWSIAAIGPKKLAEMGMDPEQIMQFAEEYCAVEVEYQRPAGAVVKAQGFDFSRETHLARGGLISPEWTSQMIISFKKLSQYFLEVGEKEKALLYYNKAEFYLDELNKLIISSPSARGQGDACLPYATLEDADTGHGWNTPLGDRTCSVAGTAYMILAIQDFNPLMFEEKR